MAFIRAYAEAGDPFRFRLPRIIRPPKKLRAAIGKVAKVAKVAAPFVPGLGAIALPVRMAALAGKAAKLKRGISLARSLAAPPPAAVEEPPYVETDEEPEEPMTYPDYGFARGYGYWQGDATPRRKRASAGPKAKAAVKAEKRVVKATRPTQTGPQKRRRQPGQPGIGSMILGNAVGAARTVGGAIMRNKGNIIGLGQDILRSQQAGGLPDFGVTGIAGGGRMPRGFGGKRRSMNPTNVKALRRSLRRVESFSKVAERVRKDAAKMLRHAGGPQHRCAPARGRKR